MTNIYDNDLYVRKNFILDLSKYFVIIIVPCLGILAN